MTAFLRWSLVILVALVPWIMRAVYYPTYPGADDAFIHMAIVDSLLETGTWGINPGETVHLSTSPLFTLVFLALSFLSRDLLTMGAIVSVCLVAGAVTLTFLIAERRLKSFFPSLAIAGIAATNIHLWRWTGTFMEATFAYFLVVLNVYLHLSIDGRTGRSIVQGVLLGLTALVRPELALLPLALLAHGLVSDRAMTLRRLSWVVLGVLAVAVPYVLWSNAYFGSVLPTTFYAKTSGSMELANFDVAKQLAQVVASGLPALALVAVLAAVLARKSDSRAEQGDALLFLLVPLLGFLFFYLKTPMLQSAGRYFLPFLATLPLLAIPMVQRARLSPSLVVGCVVIQAGTALFLNTTRIAPVLRGMWDGYVATMREGAQTIKARVPEGNDVLVYYDIGVVSWELKGAKRIVDGGALASPELKGLQLDEMVAKTGVKYVFESLGNPEYPIEFEGRPSKILWERSFRSHGVENPDRTYVARLYELGE